MPKPSRTALLRYGVSVVTVGLALLVTLQVNLLATRTPFALFFAAVMVSTWYGGRIPGLLAIALSALVSYYFIVPTVHSLTPERDSIMQVVTFLLVALLINWLTAARLRSEQLTRESEQRFRLLVEGVKDYAIYTLGPQGHVASWNVGAERLKGYRVGEILGKHFSIFFTPEGIAQGRPQQLLKRAAEEGRAADEGWRIRKDGTRFWADVVITALIDEAGGLLGFSKLTRDATERKRAEEELHEADQRAIREYERLLDRAGSLAQALGTARDLRTVFRAALGFARESVPCDGLLVYLYDPEQDERRLAYAWSAGEEVDLSTLPALKMSEPARRVVETGEPIFTDDYQAEVSKVVRLGADKRGAGSALTVPMSVMGRVVGAVEVQSFEKAAYRREHATAVRMAANLAANAVENVRLLESERAQAEQLRQSQKLESIGTLAGGVAHDFNNLLTVISGNAQLALARVGPDAPIRQHLIEVEKAADRAATLTRQLLAFSRRQQLERKTINLNDTIGEILKLLQRTIGADVEVRFHAGAGLSPVFADPAQIEQVVMNLAVNARDAMPDGGRLIIETSNMTLDRTYLHRHPLTKPGSYVQISVSDTGTGMDEGTKARIFEPFFTTKAVGKGTGLGLAMVFGIVKQHDGLIEVYSEAGLGTTFKIFLPVDHKTVAEEKHEALPALRGGAETILVADDEEPLRGLARSVLEDLGYTALLARDGAEALEIYAAERGRINLVVLDVVMPRMGGYEAYARIRSSGGEVPVIFMTGYSAEMMGDKLDDGDQAPLLQKPYSVETFGRKVREVLDASVGR